MHNINQVGAPSRGIRALAWAKRNLPLQSPAGRAANLTGGLIKTVWSGYDIGGYRRLADAFNQSLKQKHPLAFANIEQGSEDIYIPPNPYIHFGKEFTKNETWAGIAGSAAVFVADYLLDLLYDGHCPMAIKAPVLALVQPVIEKPALVARDILKAYRDSPTTVRRPLAEHYRLVRQGLSAAFPTLRADIIYHDTCQAALMGLLTAWFDPTSLQASLLQAISFTTAFFAAIALEVKSIDLSYRLFGEKLQRMGFGSEQYYEVRFKVVPDRPNNQPQAVLQLLAQKFGLQLFPDGYLYHDRYVDKAEITDYNARKPFVCFREREEENHGLNRSVQFTFTRPFKLKRGGYYPYNCYPVLKDKHYFLLPKIGPMCWQAEDAPSPQVSRAVNKAAGKSCWLEFYFWRFAARDPEGLLVTIDIPGKEGAKPDLSQVAIPYWIELKVHGKDNLPLLAAANDFVIRDCSVDPTTKAKVELAAAE